MIETKNINTLIIEGPECQFKYDLINAVHDYYKGQYLVLTHGDIYEHVYATKNNITPVKHTHGMSILYLVCNHINDELAKESQLYLDEAKKLKDIYDIVRLDIVDENIHGLVSKIINIVRLSVEQKLDKFADEKINTFNEMYVKACNKYGLTWRSIDNQPYLNNRQIMVDNLYYNGSYETYEDKSIPDNLLYSAAYTNTKSCNLTEFLKKEYDVQYPINSKILYRKDAKDYMLATIKSSSLYTLHSEYIDEFTKNCTPIEKSNIHTFNKAFGDNYIKELSKAKATIITNRDIAQIELMTARWYESVMANCVIFVDRETDPKNKVLSQIYGKDSQYIDLLTVDPE